MKQSKNILLGLSAIICLMSAHCADSQIPHRIIGTWSSRPSRYSQYIMTLKFENDGNYTETFVDLHDIKNEESQLIGTYLFVNDSIMTMRNGSYEYQVVVKFDSLGVLRFWFPPNSVIEKDILVIYTYDFYKQH